MGKGARTRAKRKEAAQKAKAEELTESLLDELFTVEDAAHLRRLVSRHPELLGRDTEDQLRSFAAIDGYGATFERFAELLSGARTDLDDAWAKYAEAKAHADQLAEELEGVEDRIQAASKRRDFDEMIDLIESAIPRQAQVASGHLARAHTRRAQDA